MHKNMLLIQRLLPPKTQFAKTIKSMPCTYFNQGTCLQKKSHEKPFHMLKLNVKINTKVRQKMIKLG